MPIPPFPAWETATLARPRRLRVARLGGFPSTSNRRAPKDPPVRSPAAWGVPQSGRQDFAPRSARAWQAHPRLVLLVGPLVGPAGEVPVRWERLEVFHHLTDPIVHGIFEKVDELLDYHTTAKLLLEHVDAASERSFGVGLWAPEVVRWCDGQPPRGHAAVVLRHTPPS